MENTLPSLLSRVADFREGVLDRLTASEASLLCTLTAVHLDDHERYRFFHPLKQLGPWQDWARRKLEEGFKVTLVGKDIERLMRDINNPIQSWHDAHRPVDYTIWIAIIHPRACFQDVNVDHTVTGMLAAPELGYQTRRYKGEHLFEVDYNPALCHFPSVLCAGIYDVEALADAINDPLWSVDGPVLNGRTLVLRRFRERSPTRRLGAGYLCSHLVEPVEGRPGTFKTSFLIVGHRGWVGSTLEAETELYDEHNWDEASWLSTPQTFIELSIMGTSRDYAVFQIPLTTAGETAENPP